ncbi:MAG: hypothetical protein HYX73_10970, partial [Acidobacteria bacterium]|nr:hypothetical protein [Acidobacteriota bacterium]
TSYDEAWGVAVDATGVYVAGITGGALPGQTSVGGDDAFVRKYDFSGNLLWTHQFGTSNPDSARGVAVDAAGVYVVGTILSGSLPGQTSAGNYDAFVRKYDSNGNELWTRQFGTASPDQARGVAVDATSVYIVGGTNGALPGQTSAGSSDAFVRRYDANGTELWTRQFGSSSFGFDEALGVAVDSTGVYVTGTAGGTLPGQTSAGAGDAFVRKYDATGAELWTLQFGSDNFFSSDWAYGVAVDTSAVYVGGRTTGTLPGQTSAGGQDAFVVKIVEPSTGPAVSDGGVVNHASFAPSPAPVALGSIAAVFGTNLNDGSTTVATSFGPDGKLGTALGGASVTINNTPAPMFYSTPGQLGIQIPFELTGLMSATIVVTVGGQSSVSRTINLDAVAPGIFTLTSDGEGAAAALHENGLALVTAGNPAHPGELVVLFATGLGAASPPLATGALSTGNQTVAIPAVTIDGIPGNVEFSGTVPGSVGLNLIRVRIPLATRSAPDIPVVLTIDGKQSNEVTIAVSP